MFNNQFYTLDVWLIINEIWWLAKCSKLCLKKAPYSLNCKIMQIYDIVILGFLNNFMRHWVARWTIKLYLHREILHINTYAQSVHLHMIWLQSFNIFRQYALKFCSFSYCLLSTVSRLNYILLTDTQINEK